MVSRKRYYYLSMCIPFNYTLKTSTLPAELNFGVKVDAPLQQQVLSI